MSADTILDLTAAAVVFGSVLVVAYWDEIVKKIIGTHDRNPKGASGPHLSAH